MAMVNAHMWVEEEKAKGMHQDAPTDMAGRMIEREKLAQALKARNATR